MDPFKLLKEDHDKVADLFKRIESASGQNKLKLFKELKSELDLHADIEETIFYPPLEKASESHDITLEAYEEHKVVKDLLAQLAGAKKPSDEWDAKLTVLRENVEHHVEEEEGELFDKASDVLTGEQAEALGDRMAAEKKRRGGTVSTKKEKPGLIKTITTALGIGGPSHEPEKKSRKTSAVSSKTKSASVTAQKRTSSGKRAGAKAATARGRKSPTRKAAGKSKAGAGTKSRSVAAGR